MKTLTKPWIRAFTLMALMLTTSLVVNAAQKVTVKTGKKVKIKASVTKPAKKKVKKYRAISFESTDPAVAAVSSKGIVTGKKKGSCKIYVYAQNGVYKTITVTVK